MLHNELKFGKWQPQQYTAFFIYDPKLRKIHKATVRDRVLYQAVYRVLNRIFDKIFIHDSYSSRDRKGTHKGVERFETYIRKVTKSHTRAAFVVKCDIRKFFDSIDHATLYELVSRKIQDQKLLSLIRTIINSFEILRGKGLPLGNVTSQIFANIYMNELDQFIKHSLKAKFYVRYCDDFVMVDESKRVLKDHVEKIGRFCRDRLALELHPRKIIFRTVHQGTDFLGYVSLPHRRVVRTKTKNRMLRKIEKIKGDVTKGTITFKSLEKSIQSYIGVLSHAKSKKIKDQIEDFFKD